MLFAACAKYTLGANGAEAKEVATVGAVPVELGAWLPQPANTADKMATETNLVVFRLFNTGLHSGKMLPLV
ncbi:hypothetical protein NUITMVS2_02550 [Shewanella xiamenensis]|nr:hypothetical protein NUITMVS2_02550 [Shewanella xiamenensis]